MIVPGHAQWGGIPGWEMEHAFNIRNSITVDVVVHKLNKSKCRIMLTLK